MFTRRKFLTFITAGFLSPYLNADQKVVRYKTVRYSLLHSMANATLSQSNPRSQLKLAHEALGKMFNTEFCTAAVDTRAKALMVSDSTLSINALYQRLNARDFRSGCVIVLGDHVFTHTEVAILLNETGLA